LTSVPSQIDDSHLFGYSRFRIFKSQTFLLLNLRYLTVHILLADLTPKISFRQSNNSDLKWLRLYFGSPALQPSTISILEDLTSILMYTRVKTRALHLDQMTLDPLCSYPTLDICSSSLSFLYSLDIDITVQTPLYNQIY
jgi:hypothetical protein